MSLELLEQRRLFNVAYAVNSTEIDLPNIDANGATITAVEHLDTLGEGDYSVPYDSSTHAFKDTGPGGTGLTPGTYYSYTETIAGGSESDGVSTYPDTPEDPRHVLALVSSGHHLHVQWTGDWGNDVTMHVLVSSDGSTYDDVSDVAATTHSTDINLSSLYPSDPQDYIHVQIYAVNNTTSNTSSTVSVDRVSAIVAPTDLNGVPSSGSVVLTWTPAWDSTFTGTKIYRSTDGGQTWSLAHTITGSTSTWTDTSPGSSQPLYKACSVDEYGAGVFCNSVTVNMSTSGNLISDGGFEQPVQDSSGLGMNAFTFGPDGSAWMFSDDHDAAGVTANDTWATTGTDDAPEGVQQGMIQGLGYMTQIVSLPAGNYVLDFKAAQRGGYSIYWGVSNESILVGGMSGGAITPSGTSYQSYAEAFHSDGGPQVITFAGGFEDTAGLTDLALIDDVTLTYNSVLTSLNLTPGSPTIAEGAHLQLAPAAFDQFGYQMPLPAGLSWSVSGTGSGTVDSSGMYTAPTSDGVFMVTATDSATGVSASAVITVATAAGPVSDWQFSGNSGTTASDQSGWNDDGTLINGPTWSGAPDGATGLYFNGTDQSVSIPDAPQLDPSAEMGIGVWLNASDWGTRTILQKGSGDSLQYVLKAIDDGGTEKLEFNVPGYDSVIAPAPSTGSWHSILAGVKDGDPGLILVIDGEEYISYGGGVTIPSSTEPLTIGDVPGSTNSADAFEGTIAEVRITPDDWAALLSGPAITTAAAASDATPTTIDLTVAGSDPSLTYTWVATHVPAGAADPFFSDNGDSSAASTKATFFAAGVYDFEVLVSNGVLTTSSVLTGVTVDQTLTSIDVLPNDTSLDGLAASGTTIAPSATHWLSGIGLDQFGKKMVSQPTVTWSAADGSIVSGVYHAPSSTGTDTVTGSVTGSTATGSTTFTIESGAPASATTAPSAVSSVTAIAEDGTGAQINWTASSTADGYLIEASTDGGSTYNPIGTAQGADTMFLATGLTANASYLFRVTPFNAAGLATSGTVSSAMTVGDTSGEGWYKVSFNDPGNPSAAYESIAPDSFGEYGGSPTGGSITLSNSDWIYADSQTDAVRQALTGYRYVGAGGDKQYLNQSSLFQYVLDYDDGTTDIGPAIVLSDGSGGSRHTSVPLNVTKEELAVNASDADPFAAPSGSLALGTFDSTDPSASVTNYDATIMWQGGGSAAGTISALGNGVYGVSIAASSIPGGAPSTPGYGDGLSYAIKVTHGPTTLSAADSKDEALPPSLPASPVTHLNRLRPITGVFIQHEWETVDVPSQADPSIIDRAGPENFYTWEKRGVNTIIDIAGFNAGGTVGPNGIFYGLLDDLGARYVPHAAPPLLSPSGDANTNGGITQYELDPTFLNEITPSDSHYWPALSNQVVALAGALRYARIHNMSYVLPIYNVYALTEGLRVTTVASGATESLKQMIIDKLPDAATWSDGEWSDPNLRAVNVRQDEPNGGEIGGEKETFQQYDADIKMIHLNHQKVYVALSGSDYRFHNGEDYETSKIWAFGYTPNQSPDYVGMDFYSVSFYGEDLYADTSAHPRPGPGLTDITTILTRIKANLARAASLQVFLEASTQGVTPFVSFVRPSATQMGDEYITVLRAGVQGICWFPEGPYGNDSSTSEEIGAVTNIDANLLSGGIRRFAYSLSLS